MLCDTVSKALVKSTNSIPTNLAFFLLLLSTSQLGVLTAVLFCCKDEQKRYSG